MTALADRREHDQRATRFIAFGLAVALAIGSLTARLVYLQVAEGANYANLDQPNMISVQPVLSSRGLVFDRNGVPLVRNVASFTVGIRAADLPLSRRREIANRLSSLLGADPSAIVSALDAHAGSRFDLVRIARDVPRATADLITESHVDLPGVEVVLESRREYAEGPLLSQVVGYTGPVGPDQLSVLLGKGYLRDDAIGRAGVEAVYEATLRGTYGSESVARDATGRKLEVLQTLRAAEAGSSVRLTIDLHEQQFAEEALRWGMEAAGLKRGAVIVMNPQTGEVLAMVSLPTYDNNEFSGGISNNAYAALLADPDQPLLNHAISAHYPPGSTYKLVAGTGALSDGKIDASTRLQTAAYLTLGRTRFYDWNKRGWGACDLDCGFGHSSDTYFFQLGSKLGIDRLGHWAGQYGFGNSTGIDLPGEVKGIVPTNQWKLDAIGEPIYPGEVYQAAIGQGYDAVTPIQLVNAYAALANGGRLYEPQVVREIVAADGAVVRAFEPKLIRELDAPKSALQEMREATRNVQLLRHTYNLVDLPIVMAGKSGTAEFGVRDRRGRLPFHSWFVAFVPQDPYKRADDPKGLKAVARTDSELVVLAFAYDSGTRGNAATEIVKHYLQLHFGITKDYRNHRLLERGNFYQSN